MEENNITLEDLIKNAIAGRGLSMKEAAKRLNIGRTTLYAEIGRAIIDPAFEQNVRKTLGIDIEDLKKQIVKKDYEDQKLPAETPPPGFKKPFPALTEQQRLFMQMRSQTYKQYEEDLKKRPLYEVLGDLDIRVMLLENK